MVNELRKDYLLDRWVVIAGNRGKRPSDFLRKVDEEPEKTCFFCPGNEHMTPPEICRIPQKGKKWSIRCFPNKFPALVPEEGESTKGLLESRPAYGFHEVLVETPQHGESIADLNVVEMTEVLEAYNQRILDLESREGVGYVCLFKNHGKVSGASLSHSHTQIITLPFTPPLVKAEADASKRYFREHGSCVFCDLIKRESKSPRKVIDRNNVLAFTPYASRHPFEVWLAPKKHVRRLDDLSKTGLKSMASTLLSVVRKLRKGLNDPSYNLMLHYSSKRGDLHMHWELAPRLSTWAGFELGSEVVINTMPPEHAARHLRGF
jgi:UDPglucose--hexose-1-phosphate uridylyltransferase